MNEVRLPTLHPLADFAYQLRWDDAWSLAITRQITALARAGLQEFASERIDVVPGLATLTFIPTRLVDDNELQSRIERLIREMKAHIRDSAKIIELPICYDGEYGPDLDEVARHTGLSTDDVIARHLGAEYLVAILGFSPGFPYLCGLPTDLTTPRRASPRLQIPAGSVGIAGMQTGIYPQATPGGWQLIGRTPTRLFGLDKTPPALLQLGDRVRFRRIDAAEFATLHATVAQGTGR